MVRLLTYFIWDWPRIDPCQQVQWATLTNKCGKMELSGETLNAVVVFIYFRAHIHLWFKHAVLGTQLSELSVYVNDIVFVSVLISTNLIFKHPL